MNARKKIQLIAHRGASSEAPENTLIAIRKAIELGVDYIEFDVRLTSEGIPIIMHDPTVFRTTNAGNFKYIHNLNLEEIMQLDAGSWFDSRFADEKIPSLQQVLQMEVKQSGLMIEIKKGTQTPETIVAAILKVIDSAKPHGKIVLGSFSIPITEEMQKNAPHLRMMGIIEEKNMIEEFISKDIKLIALWYKLVNPQLIREMHDQGIEVWTFTVDDPPTVNLLTSIGIDGIITNHPKLIQELCGFKRV